MNSIYIKTVNISGKLLWQHFIDIENWPKWITNTKLVTVDGEFKENSKITLHNIDGTKYECEIIKFIIKKKKFTFAYSKTIKSIDKNIVYTVTSEYNFEIIDDKKTKITLNREHPGIFQIFLYHSNKLLNNNFNHIDDFLNYLKKNYIIKIKQEMEITENLAKELINAQFPEYKSQEISKVYYQGHDNTTFHLGNNLIISLPNGPQYAKRIDKYYKFLPEIQSYLKIQIPQIIHLGRSSSLFKHHWTISKWIEGKSLNLMINKIDLNIFAFELGTILKSFKSIYFKSEELIPSKSNWHRGGNLSKYNKEVMQSLKILGNIVKQETILKIWNHALSSPWEDHNIFVHGDIALGNIIYDKGKLTGLIDFGGMAIGDPACDLMIAYTALDKKNREIFKNTVSYDKNTWIRAMGWTLWKGLIELAGTSKSNAKDWEYPKKVINEIKEDYKNYI